ncbi:DUF2795 domain-containing protein [Streptomyces sp. NPDC052101]|uniref:DUF2795 domain-containing protein n=1 Tax=Streptomyces sp. NPDC052101 TaxID=3155763 RepID=UPI003424C8EB
MQLFTQLSWPMNKKALIEHAKEDTGIDRDLLDQLTKLPDREYKSAPDVQNALVTGE